MFLRKYSLRFSKAARMLFSLGGAILPAPADDLPARARPLINSVSERLNA